MNRGLLASKGQILLALATFSAGFCFGCRHLEVVSYVHAKEPAKLSTPTAAVRDPKEESKRVLVLANQNSTESLEIARYYMAKRSIPSENLVTVNCPDKEDITQDDFQSMIAQPVRVAINKLGHSIDYIVMTHGIPLRFNAGYGYSVDGGLVGMDSKVPAILSPDPSSIRAAQSPYFGLSEHFSHAKFDMYLVTRLDGYSLEDIKALIDHSVAAKPEKGLFYFQPSSSRTRESFGELQTTMGVADAYLKEHKFQTRMGSPIKYEAPAEPVMGYVEWGSNDNRFNQSIQDQLKFKAGSIAETYVSTSARTFAPSTGGQSKIADLIHQGVTGVKGYVSEPFTFALCHADILLARYTSGFNLAESFYMASPILKWKDVVIGDPLCNPYRPR